MGRGRGPGARLVPAIVAVAGVALSSACSAGGDALPSALDGVVSSVAILDDDANALRGRLELDTTAPTRARVELRNPNHVVAISSSAATERHRIPLLQLRADREYDVHVTLLDESGAALGDGVIGSFQTDPLPHDLPPVTVERADLRAMTPGLTLFNQVYRPPAVEGADGFEDEGFLTAVDERGEVVWYHREPLGIQDARRLEDGDLLFISDETGARRITPTGDVVAEWRGTSPGSDEDGIGHGLPAGGVIEVPIHSMHHEIMELPDGNMLTLTREMRQITYPEPLCDDNAAGPSVEDVVGDAVAIFEADTGEVVAEYSLFDVLDPRDDPRKLDGDLCIDYLDRHYPDAQPRDWTHANAVIPIDDGRAFLLSLRHTDQLVAIHAEGSPGGPAGSLAWTLGPDEPIELQGGGRWFWHQHAPELQPDGSILLYDNGNGRLDAEAPYSRAVRYRVDPAAGTAREVWRHDLDEEVYAFFLGDADALDGTVLVTHGGQTAPCTATADENDTYVWGRVIEVDAITGEVVFDLRTRDPETCAGWSIYRAERIETIYPAGFDVDVIRR